MAGWNLFVLLIWMSKMLHLLGSYVELVCSLVADAVACLLELMLAFLLLCRLVSLLLLYVAWYVVLLEAS